QILIPVAEVITHAATVDPHSPVVSSCPKGPRSRACLGSGVGLLVPSNAENSPPGSAERPVDGVTDSCANAPGSRLGAAAV
ncbi:MAG: hypothetical protein ABSF89_04280, partial [Acidimicrobiales bacterium]